MKDKLFIPLFLGIMIFFTACEKTQDILPNNSDLRDDFIGEWTCSETELKSTEDYTVTIEKNPQNSSQVVLQNFGLLGPDAFPYAYITDDRITLPQQTVNGYTIKNANGELVDQETIEWTYTLNDGSDDNKYEATYTKK